MSTLFPTLFSPVRLGPVEVRNRIVSTGHDTNLPAAGAVTDALIAYHGARARGGVGLIVCQVIGVHASARYTSHILMGETDDCIPGLRRLAEAVKAEGARFFAQLFHPGREIMETADGAAPVAYAPSATPSERFRVRPRAMSLALIEEMVAGYGATARRVAEAGADGVEIVASHGYLPAQFLSPMVNRRDDAYGGDPERRLRFLREIIAAARAEISQDMALGLRISGGERHEGGLSEEDALAAIAALAPSLDYVSIVAGSSATAGGAVHIVPPMSVEHAYLAPFGERAKAAVDIPVVVTGRINQPQQAEAMLTEGRADLVGMTRAMICDPEMPAKAREDRFDDVRACIGCNQACIGHFHKGAPISCIQHPETGRELDYGAVAPAAEPRSVLVAGGGPAGMKAAAVAAARGHRVTLCEASGRLGGQALLAQMLPHRAEFGGIVDNLSREMALAGVAVETGVSVDREFVEERRPDVVIVATGATPYWPEGLEIAEDAQAIDAWAALLGVVNIGGSVVIADWRSDWVGVGLAEMLAVSGRRVRLAVNGLHAAETLPNYVRDAAAGRLHDLGVEVIPYARLYGADADTVYLQHTASEAAMIVEEVDTLVLAQGSASDDALLADLQDYDGRVVAIGDCLSPRTAEEAVLDGLRAGWEI